jgi:hypothetical protein
MNRAVKAVLPFSPVVGMVSTCLLVAAAVGQCSKAILAAGWSLQIATVLYHLIGGLAGYFIPKVSRPAALLPFAPSAHHPLRLLALTERCARSWLGS